MSSTPEKTPRFANLTKGIFKENPLIMALLGLCPALAITTSLENAIGMGMAVLIVLVCSNFIVSLIRKIVPSEIRIPVYIVIIATFVTMVDMLLAAFIPALSSSLGLFIPLIVVNCIILGRAEAFASNNGPIRSIIDGVGMAIGYTAGLVIIASIRELLGKGTLTLWTIYGGAEPHPIRLNLNPASGKLPIFSDFFTSPAGAFIVLGVILAVIAALKNRHAKIVKARERAARAEAARLAREERAAARAKEAAING